jgi:hypothetical protein
MWEAKEIMGGGRHWRLWEGRKKIHSFSIARQAKRDSAQGLEVDCRVGARKSWMYPLQGEVVQSRLPKC